VHPQLLKLLATWDGIFPPQLLTVLKQRVAQDVPSQANGNALQSGQAQSSHWGQRVANDQQPVSSTNTSIPSTSGRNGYYAAPHVTGRLMSASYQHPQQRQDSFQSGYAAPQAQASQRQWQSHQAAQQAGSVQYSQQSSCQPLVLPNLLSSLLSSGLLTVPPSVSIAPSGLSAAPAVFYTHPPSRAATPEAVDPEDCKFVPSRLKVLSWPLVTALATCICCLLQVSLTVCFVHVWVLLEGHVWFKCNALQTACCSSSGMKGLCCLLIYFGILAVKIVHDVLAQQCTCELSKRAAKFVRCCSTA